VPERFRIYCLFLPIFPPIFWTNCLAWIRITGLGDGVFLNFQRFSLVRLSNDERNVTGTYAFLVPRNIPIKIAAEWYCSESSWRLQIWNKMADFAAATSCGLVSEFLDWFWVSVHLHERGTAYLSANGVTNNRF
jgi:hypothetical protein